MTAPSPSPRHLKCVFRPKPLKISAVAAKNPPPLPQKQATLFKAATPPKTRPSPGQPPRKSQ